MVAKTKMENLEQTFLEYMCENRMPLTIFLINGVKLQGSITRLATECMLLSRDGHSQLVYRHAISTIMPESPVELTAD